MKKSLYLAFVVLCLSIPAIASERSPARKLETVNAVALHERAVTVPTEKTPFVEVYSWIAPGEGAAIETVIFTNFFPSGKVVGQAALGGVTGPKVTGSPATIESLEEGNSPEIIESYLKGSFVEPLHLPIALLHEQGIVDITVDIPYGEEIVFRASGGVEVEPFDFYIDACAEGGLVNVVWRGFSISPNVAKMATIRVDTKEKTREKAFSTTLDAPGIWNVEVRGFSPALYDTIFAVPEGVSTSITLDGETVERWWWFIPAADLFPCEEGHDYGEKG